MFGKKKEKHSDEEALKRADKQYKKYVEEATENAINKDRKALNKWRSKK